MLSTRDLLLHIILILLLGGGVRGLLLLYRTWHDQRFSVEFIPQLIIEFIKFIRIIQKVLLKTLVCILKEKSQYKTF